MKTRTYSQSGRVRTAGAQVMRYIAGIAAAGGCCGLAIASAATTTANTTTNTQPWGCPNYPCKPAQAEVRPFHAKDRIDIRFNTGLKIREQDGQLVDRGTGVLADPVVQAVLGKYQGGRWQRVHTLPEEKLDELRANAEGNLGIPVADLNLSFTLILPAGADPATAINDFNALGIVEMAEPALTPMPMPLPGNYQANQRYHFATTDGTNCFGVRLLPGGYGQALSRVCDIEYSWNFAHEDLPAITFLGPAAVDPFNDNNHGTAVLGEICSRDNGWGTVGGVPNATVFCAAANTAGGYNVASAITTALGSLGIGDCIIIEQQIAGPNYTGVPAGTQFGLVPVEWNRNIYNAIVTAIGNNVLVLEAAGNGSQNLNDAIYATGNGGHFPFNGTINSGAIIVGAGGSPTGGGDRSRLGFSCYGTRVNLQGWGQDVYTTGYGNLFSAEGVNRWFTSSFSGTSSATPIVTSAAVAFSSLHRELKGSWPTPAIIRTALATGAAPQLNGFNPSTQNIGPRPNVIAAINSITGLIAPANDLCASAQVLTGVTGQVTGRTLGATADVTTGACGSSNGNPDVWYRFTAPSYPGTLTVSTCGTHDYAGCVDCGQDSVIGLYSACGGVALDCNDDASPACAGDASIFRDSQLSRTLVAGESILVRVSKFSTTSANGFLLNYAFAPANNTCANAQIIPSAPASLTGTLVNATNEGANSGCGITAASPDVWYAFTACTTGTLTVSTCGTHDLPGQDLGVDTVLSIYDACGGTELACSDDDSQCSSLDLGTIRDSVINLSVTAGQSMLIRVANYNNGLTGSFKLNVNLAAPNNNCVFGAQSVTTGATLFNTACTGNSLSFSEPACVTFGDGNIYKDLWFRYTPTGAGPVRIDTCGSTFDTKVAVYAGGCPILPGNVIACNDDSACGVQSILVVQGTAGQQLNIRVGGFGPTSFGPGTLNIFCGADWNRSGAVTVQDIFDFLSSWFAGSGDFNGQNGNTVQDIFDFLAAWFAGCP